MNWNEKAERVVEAEHPGGLYLNGGFVYGARWQREALLTDEAVERVARGIYRYQAPAHLACVMTQWEEAHETQRDHFRAVTRVALTAAIEGDE